MLFDEPPHAVPYLQRPLCSLVEQQGDTLHQVTNDHKITPA